MSGKSVLYVQTSGLEAPDRVYAPFILAIEAVAAGRTATIYFLLEGVTIMKKGASEKIKLEGYPPLDRSWTKQFAPEWCLRSANSPAWFLG